MILWTMEGFEQACRDGLFTASQPHQYIKKNRQGPYQPKPKHINYEEQFRNAGKIDSDGVFVSGRDHSWFIGFSDGSYAASFNDGIGSIYMKSTRASVRRILRILYAHKELCDYSFGPGLVHPNYVHTIIDAEWYQPPVSVFDTELAKELDNWVIVVKDWGAYYDTQCFHEPKPVELLRTDEAMLLHAALRSASFCDYNGIRYWGYLYIDGQNLDYDIWTIDSDGKIVQIMDGHKLTPIAIEKYGLEG